MRSFLLGATVGLATTTSSLAGTEAPYGIFRCHDQNMNPFATLLLDGRGMYQLIAAKGPDFAPDPGASHNGAGAYGVEGTRIAVENGPLRVLFAEPGNFLGGGSEATIGFDDGKGRVMTCLPAS